MLSLKLLRSFLLLLSVCSAAIQHFEVAYDPTTVEQVSTMLLHFLPSVPMAAGDYFELDIPPQIQVPQGLTPHCYETNNPDLSVECQGLNQKVKLTLKTPYSSQSLIKLQMGSFTNPNTTHPTPPFSISSFFANATLLESAAPDASVTFSATYGLMPLEAISLTTSNPVGYSSSTLNITYNVTKPFSSLGKFRLEFPPYIGSASYYYGRLTFSSWSSSIFYLRDSATDGFFFQFIGNSSQLEPNSPPIVLSISNIRNPLYPINLPINVTLYDMDGYPLEGNSNVTLYGVTEPYSYNRYYWHQAMPVGSLHRLATASSYGTIFQQIAQLYASIQYPPDFSASRLQNTRYYGRSSLLESQSNGLSVFLPNVTDAARYGSFSLTFIDLPYPTTTKRLDPFNVTFYTNGFTPLYRLKFFIEADQAEIQNPTLVASSHALSDQTAWRLSFISPSLLEYQTEIRVALPPQLSYVEGPCNPLTALVGLPPSTSCGITNGNLTISFTPSTTIPSLSLISFTLPESALANPIVESHIDPFPLSVFAKAPSDGQFWIVQSGSILTTYTAIDQSFPVSVELSPLDSCSSSSKYTFSLLSTQLYPPTSLFYFKLPRELFFTHSSSTLPCAALSSNLQALECLKLNSTHFLMNPHFSTAQSAASLFKFQIEGVSPHRSRVNSSSFEVYMEADGHFIDRRTSRVQVNGTQLSLLTFLSMTRSSDVAYADTSFLFHFQAACFLISGDSLRISAPVLPNPLSLNCTLSTSPAQLIPCSLLNSLLIVPLSLPQMLSPSQTLSLRVEGYQNPHSLAPFEPSFSFSIFSTEGNFMDTKTSTIPLTPVHPAPLIPASSPLTLSTLAPLSEATYSIRFSTLYTVEQSSTLQLKLPDTVAIPSPFSCSLYSQSTLLSSSWTYKTSTRTIRLGFAFHSSSVSPQSLLTLNLTSLINPPTIALSSSFSLSILSPNGYLSQSLSSGLQVRVDCNSPCASCSPAHPSVCFTCLSGYQFINQQCEARPCVQTSSQGACQDCLIPCASCAFSQSNCTSCVADYFLRDNECFTCESGFYGDEGLCKPCDSSSAHCQECSLTPSNCTSCLEPLYLSNGTCSQSCAAGFLGQNGACLPCDSASHCSQCAGSLSNCTACLSPYFLQPNATCSLWCDAGFFGANGECQECDPRSHCLYCSPDASTCTHCLDSYLLHPDGTCALACADGFYEVNGLCKPCDQSAHCSQCVGSASHCSACSSGFFLFSDGTCSSSCGLGFFSSADSLCHECEASSHCSDCSLSGTLCVSCQPPYFLNSNGTCSLSCDPGYFGSNGLCQPCSSTAFCATCSGTASTCTSCLPHYFLSNHTCSTLCSPGFFSLQGLCQPCSAGCRECSTSSTSCTSCHPGSVLLPNSTCSSSCQPGSFQSNGLCQECSAVAHCSQCQTSASSCTQCISPYYLSNSSCALACPEGYYGQSGVCRPCDATSNCLACRGSASNCTSCLSGFFWSPEGTCSRHCPDGYFQGAGGVCRECDAVAHCSECSGNGSVCTACEPGFFLSNSTCSLSCPSGSFPLNGLCQSCLSPCLQCSQDASSCSVCESGFLLLNQSCVSSCPSGYFQDNGHCSPCSPGSHCSQCLTDGTGCVSCLPNYFLSNATCSTACPSGFYAHDALCLQCDASAHCSECVHSASTCTSCLSPYRLLPNATCSLSCPSGFFQNQHGLCQQCSIASHCKECVSHSTNCSSCLSPFYLSHSSCSLQCPSGFYGDQGLCRECDALSFCAECSGSSSSCSSCVSGFTLFNHTCLQSCPSAYFSQDGLCKPCDSSSHCSQCVSSPSFCTSCQSGWLLSNSSCVSSCPLGSFSSDSVCKPCDTQVARCRSCESSASLCTSCESGLFLQSSRCIAPCDQGYFFQSSSCHRCPSHCKRCLNAEECLECFSDFWFYESRCLSSCPSFTTVPHPSSSSCLACDSNCQTCEGASNVCSSCPSHMYLTQSRCHLCDQSCARCEGSSLSCSACHQGLYLYNHQCVSSCPPHFFPVQQTSQCEECASECMSCSVHSLNCSSCLGSHLLLRGSCAHPLPLYIVLALILLCLLLSLNSKILFRSSFALSNFVALLSILESALLLAQLILASLSSHFLLAFLALLCLSALWVTNVVLTTRLKTLLKSHQNPHPVRFHPSVKFVLLLSNLVNSKLARLLYSRFCRRSLLPPHQTFLLLKLKRAVFRASFLSLLTCGLLTILFNVAVLVGWVSASAPLLLLCVSSFLLQILLFVLLLFEIRFSSESLASYEFVQEASAAGKNVSADLDDKLKAPGCFEIQNEPVEKAAQMDPLKDEGLEIIKQVKKDESKEKNKAEIQQPRRGRAEELDQEREARLVREMLERGDGKPQVLEIP